MIFDKDTDGDGYCTDAGGSTRYLYCANNNFNVMALTDSAGAVVERVKYDPYGQPTCTRTSDSDVTTASHFANPWLFQGQRYCPETGLYYFKNRDHSVTLGRFLQRDRLRLRVATNRYECVCGGPTFALDPIGHEPIVITPGAPRSSAQQATVCPKECDDLRRRINGQISELEGLNDSMKNLKTDLSHRESILKTSDVIKNGGYLVLSVAGGVALAKPDDLPKTWERLVTLLGIGTGAADMVGLFADDENLNEINGAINDTRALMRSGENNLSTILQKYVDLKCDPCCDWDNMSKWKEKVNYPSGQLKGAEQ